MPNKKAYGIQTAKMCEAFIEAGVDLELVIPRTHASSIASLKDAYKLRVDISTTILPGFDLYSSGRFPFFISSCTFIITSGAYLLWKRLRGEQCLVYTADMGNFSFAPLPAFGFPVAAEMHDAKPRNIFTRYFFKHLKLLIVTNAEIRKTLSNQFDISPDKIMMEPNGVDFDLFRGAPGQEEARTELGIPLEQKVALYVGRFYEWKGLDILVDAAQGAPDIDWYVVGDTPEVFAKVTKSPNLPSNLRIMGECESSNVPLWLAAADTLLILGTKRNDQSYRYTAPMKIYEYMAASRPIVASKTPALTSIMSEHDAVWYETDSAESLAMAVESAIAKPNQDIINRGLIAAREHSWAARVKRVKTRFPTILQ